MSNEDLVRQVSLNKMQNTHITDLNNNDQVTLTIKNENKIINWILPDDLSKLVSI